MANEVEKYVQDKGWTIKQRKRVRGKENAVLDCPLCGAITTRDKHRFYLVLETGLWICNDCQETGNLYTLKKRLGDLQPVAGMTDAPDALDKQLALPDVPDALKGKEHQIDAWRTALWEDEYAVEWVTKHRSLTEAVARNAKLGLVFKDGQRWLAMPYLCNGRPVLVKFRSIDGDKAFQRMRDCPSPLYNVDDLSGEYKRVYLTEGELDALSMTAMGLTPAVSLPNGAKALEDAHVAHLERFDEIYLVTDNDKPGEDSAQAIAKRLGAYRCFRVRLSLKDANAMLQAGLQDQVREAVAKASRMGAGSVASLADILDEAVTQGTALEPGKSTGIYDLDLVIGGVRATEWTVVSGPSGGGKTALIQTLLTYQAQDGEPSLLIGPELSPQANAIRWGSQLIGKSIFNMTVEERRGAAPLVRAFPVYMLPKQGSVPIEEVLGALEFAVRRFGVTRVGLDHLDFFLKDINDREEIDKTVMIVNNAAAKFCIHILLGVHPLKKKSDEKTAAKEGREPKKPIVTINDLRGSAKIDQLSHQVLTIQDNVIRVWKRRWAGNTTKLPAQVPVTFNKSALRYEVHEPEKDQKTRAYGKDD